MSDRPKGFTLIELMIVVAIIGILAVVAVPKFADLIKRSKEGSAKGHLGALRSALTLYYADNQIFPAGPNGDESTVLTDALVPGYIKSIAAIEAYPYHAATTKVSNVSSANDVVPHEGQWEYIGGPGALQEAGALFIRCDSLDSRQLAWSIY